MTTETREVVYQNGVEYSLYSHVRFVKDMMAAGIPTELRRTHTGATPCVRVQDKDKAMKATTVGLRWLTEETNFIVFPEATDLNLAEQQKYSWGM